MNKNERKLIQEIMDEKEAKDFIENIEYTENLFDKHPLAVRNNALKSNIKDAIEKDFDYKNKQKNVFRILIPLTAAAVLVIVIAISLQFITTEKTVPQRDNRKVTKNIEYIDWQMTSDLYQEPELARVAIKIRQLEDEYFLIENTPVENEEKEDTFDEIDEKIKQLNSSIWKG